jgi:hypothetical protein
MSLLLITTVKVVVRSGDLLTSLTVTGRVCKGIFPAASRVLVLLRLTLEWGAIWHLLGPCLGLSIGNLRGVSLGYRVTLTYNDIHGLVVGTRQYLGLLNIPVLVIEIDLGIIRV